MLKKIAKPAHKINEFLLRLKDDRLQYVVGSIEAQLEAEVEMWLYREQHVRRETIKRQSQVDCQRCGSHAVNRFMRNGHRQRQWVTQ